MIVKDIFRNVYSSPSIEILELDKIFRKMKAVKNIKLTLNY